MNGKVARRVAWIVAATAVVGGVGGWCVVHWKRQADAERQALAADLAWFARSDRRAVADSRPGKARWIPNRDAPRALAVLPRTRKSDFDAIYVLFDGDRATGVLALTPIGGFFNGLAIDKSRYPDTLLPRPLDAAEREALAAIVDLLELELETTRREHPLDVQAPRYGWTQQVVATARRLLDGSNR